MYFKSKSDRLRRAPDLEKDP